MERLEGIVSPGGAPLESAAQHSPMAETMAVWSLRLARLSFGAMVVLIPFRMRDLLLSRPMPPIYHDYTDLLLFASDLFLLTTLFLWGLSWLFQPRRIKTGPLFLTLPLAGVTALAGMTSLTSVDPTVSLYHAVRLFFLAALYLYVLNEINLSQWVLPVLLQISIQAIVGIAQVLQQHSLDLVSLQELTLDPSWSGVSVIVAGGVRSLRAYGLTDHPNILGGCLAFGLLWVGAWYAGSSTRWHTLASAILALGAVALLLTFSRSAWLALGSGLAFILFLLAITRQREPLMRWVNLGGAALILLMPFVWHAAPYLGVRLNVDNAFEQVALENRSLSERDNLLRASLQLWSERPLLGVGAGALPQAEQIRYPDPNEFGADYQPVHVALLEVAAETGIFGGVMWLLAMVAPWLALTWNRRRLSWTPALIGISGLLLAVTVVGLFDYYPWLLAPGQAWQWLIWGAWGRLYSDAFAEAPVLIGAKHG